MAVVLKKKSDMECKCTRCGCLLGYDEDDLYMGVDGLGFECPECGEFITAREVDQNQWPDAFYEFGVRKGAVHIDDQSVQKYINECIERLIYDHLDYTYIGTGDTLVFASWDDEDIIVRVCQGYSEAYVNKDWYVKRRGGK